MSHRCISWRFSAVYTKSFFFLVFFEVLYCIVLYLQPVLNPKSYDGARVFFFFEVNTRVQDYTYREVMGKALIRPKNEVSVQLPKNKGKLMCNIPKQKKAQVYKKYLCIVFISFC